MEKKTLSGKNVLVTGGNRGVGKEIVQRFAEEGANIIFNSSSPNPQAEEFAKEIETKYSVECIYVTCDIRSEEEIDKMIKLAINRLKRIDILINNAGRACFGDIETLKLEDFNDCIKINLTAPFLFCQKIVPMMKENKWGRIINFTSGTTQVIQPNLGGYIAAKNGVNSITKVLAKEVGSFGITVNCLVPGCIDTDMFNDGVKGFAQSLGVSPDDVKKNVLQNHIIKDPVEPKSLANMCLYLCSDIGYGITGALIPVDHGFTC
jgi:3-hydroxybutyrate dehydrogenase